MKVAFLNIFNGKVERGSEVFVEELAGKLAVNHQVFVFQTGKKAEHNYKTIQIGGIPFLNWQGNKIMGKLFGNLILNEIYHFTVFIFTLRCLPILWREKFDWIIPINGRGQVIICRLIRFFRGGKILISGHAGVGFEDRWNMLLGKPDIFIPLSPQALSWAKNIYPENKLVYIPNGIDTEKFNPYIQPKKLPLSKPIIICVSALLPYKRIELLIAAVYELKKVNLVIIGDGPSREKISELGKKFLLNRFLLIPYVTHEEIAGYYTAAQVFSLPSEVSEAFGLVYLEAMACNIPVVAPDDINRREIIGEAGCLGDVKDKQQFAALFKKVLQTDFGNKPRKQAEKFSWKKVTSKYEEVIQKN